MEHVSGFEPLIPKPTLVKRALGSVVLAANFIKQQLTTADLNPHEGRLVASAMPEKYMNIPDSPPKDII